MNLTSSTVQTEINLYEITCLRLERGLQRACERLADGEASDARHVFERLASGFPIPTKFVKSLARLAKYLQKPSL